MKQHIVIAGGSGLIGRACRQHFLSLGYQVYILTRSRGTDPECIIWDPNQQSIARNVVEGAAAVINLCGASLADKRWTKRYKKELVESRIVPTHFLQQLVRLANVPPACYVGTSGIGIYGDQGNELIYDDSTIVATGFIPDLVKSWEQAHREVERTRNVILRVGVVLSRQGGFIGKLIMPMRFGLFPYFGSGKQILSWIHIHDFTCLVQHCIEHSEIQGTYHATSHQSVAQRDLIKLLKQNSGKPGIVFSVPALFLRLGFGEMSSILFESADVKPDKIMKAGFRHAYPDIRIALEDILKPQST